MVKRRTFADLPSRDVIQMGSPSLDCPININPPCMVGERRRLCGPSVPTSPAMSVDAQEASRVLRSIVRVEEPVDDG